jgi:hypothetical protein
MSATRKRPDRTKAPMPKATDTNTTPTPDVAPAAPATHPASVDSELLALAAEFHRCESRMSELKLPENRHRDGLEAVHADWWSAFDRAFALPAYTHAGWFAKASMLPAAIRDGGEVDSADSKAMMSLVRDMLGQNDGSPDVGLGVARRPPLRPWQCLWSRVFGTRL